MDNEARAVVDHDDGPAAPSLGRAGRRRAAAIVTAMVALVVSVGIPLLTVLILGTAPYDAIRRDFPGVDVASWAAALRALAEVSGLVTFGGLVTLLVVADGGRSLPRRGSGLLVTRVAAACWATCTFALIVVDGLDAAGLSGEQLAQPGALSYVFGATYPPAAWTVSACAAGLIAVLVQLATRWTTLLVAIWAATIGLLAPVVVGQVLVGLDHDIGSDVGAVQTLVVAAVFGVLLVAAARIAAGELLAPVVLRRLGLLAAAGLPVIAVGEVVLAWFKLAGTPLTGSVTGWQIIARSCCLVLVTAVVTALWRLARTGRLREHHLAVGAAVLTLLVAGWCAITVAMTRVPPPHYFVETSIQQVYFGFEVTTPPGLVPLLTQWRPNVLFCVLAAAGIVAYLMGVRQLRRRGDAWPRGRTVAWVAGCLVIAVATSSGVGRYSGSDLGVHMGVHMALAMLAPLLLVLGGPVTLGLRALPAAGAPHAWLTRAVGWRGLRVLQQPVIALALFVGSYYALYLSDLFGEAMRFHWAHQLMNLHFLITGYLYYGLVIGVDRPPTVLPHVGRLAYLMAAMPFHAFFGVILMTSDRLVAENFYRHVDLPWADLQASQQLAGGLAWAGGELPLILVIIVLAVQWARQDEREARRRDRAEDAGLDHELDAYNQMLDRLARRGASPTAGTDTTGER